MGVTNRPPDITSELRVGERVTFLNPTVRDPIHLEMRPRVLVAEKAPGPSYFVTHEVYGDTSWRAPVFGPFPRERLARGWL